MREDINEGPEEPEPKIAQPEPDIEQLEEERRGQAAAWANGALLVLTIPLFIWQRDTMKATDVTFLLAYVIVQFAVCAGYYILPKQGEAAAVAGVLTHEPPNTERSLARGSRKRWRSLWIPAVVNLFAMAALIWWTGGPRDSPFASVLLLMIVVGTQLVRPKVTISVTNRSELPALALGALAAYRTALAVGLMMFGLLFTAQGIPSLRHHREGSASGGEFLVLVVIALYASVLITHAGRAVKDDAGRNTLFPASEAPPLDFNEDGAP